VTRGGKQGGGGESCKGMGEWMMCGFNVVQEIVIFIVKKNWNEGGGGGAEVGAVRGRGEHFPRFLSGFLEGRYYHHA